MPPVTATSWWRRRPVRLGGALALAVAGWTALALAGPAEAALGPDRATYEGRGGMARWLGAEIAVPDLAAEPAGPVEPTAVFALRGRPWQAAIEALGRPAAAPAGAIQVWPSAVRLRHPEPGQWPVAHVALGRGSDGRVAAVALLGSLGRVLESDPGEPAYESGRRDPSRREAP